MSYTLREIFNEQEQQQLDGMDALIEQNSMAYVREAKRRGLTLNSWYSHTDDPYLKGWQAALSSMMHTFGEVWSHYVAAARARKTNTPPTQKRAYNG